MSFLYRTVPAIRTAARPSARLFSTTAVQQKVIPDAVAEPVKKVDRAVSDQLVKGIDKAVDAKDATMQAADKAKGQASKVTGQAEGEASKVAGQAKGKAEELKGEAKAKMS